MAPRTEVRGGVHPQAHHDIDDARSSVATQNLHPHRPDS